MQQPDQPADAERLARTESEIRRQAAQQAALAYAGQIALSNATLAFLFDQAADAVRKILDADCSSIYKLVAGAHLLLVGTRRSVEAGAVSAESSRGVAAQAL